jgi:tetratricopeptide (TPR) repeat protein
MLWFRCGKAYAKVGDLTSAEDAFNLVISNEPELAYKAKMELVSLLRDQGRYDDSIEMLKATEVQQFQLSEESNLKIMQAIEVKLAEVSVYRANSDQDSMI